MFVVQLDDIKSKFSEEIYEESTIPFCVEKLNAIDHNNRSYALSNQSSNSGSRRDRMRIDSKSEGMPHKNNIGNIVLNFSHPKILDEMRDRVEGKKLHIQFDGTPHVHHLFLLIASHYEDGQIVNTCLGLIDCSGRETNHGIHDCVSEILRRAGVEGSQIIGISCDRASANMKYLRDHASIAYPSAVHLPCLCHAVNSVLDKLEIPNFLFVAQKFSYYYSISDKFRSATKEYFTMTRRVPPLVNTRWAYTIDFATWFWDVRSNFRDFMLEMGRTDPFSARASILDINGMVNDSEQKWSIVLMEARMAVEMQEVGLIIKQIEGDGVRAISAFDIVSKLSNFESVINRAKRGCRGDPKAANLKKECWEKCASYIEEEIVCVGARLEESLNILDLLRMFDPFWVSDNQIDEDSINHLAEHVPSIEVHLPNLHDEMNRYISACNNFVSTWDGGPINHKAHDELLLSFWGQLDKDKFPGWTSSFEVAGALQTTSAASERGFSTSKSQFTDKRMSSKIEKMEYELMVSINT